MRSDQDLVIERCLALFTRLLRGEALSEELRAISAQYNDPDEALTDKARDRRFEEDLKRLRIWFGCELPYDAKTKAYQIDSIMTPLFDLPDEAIRGLAFLQATFSDRTVPMRNEVLALFEALQKVMPPTRWADLHKQRGQIEIDLAQRDSDEIPEQIKEQIRTACTQQRLIEFEYSPNRTDGEIVQHCAEPYTFYFEDGHYYLDAYIRESRRGTNPPTTPNILVPFRVGRIMSLKVLPNKFSRREHFRTNDLIYQLSPQIVQHGVTERFPDSVIEMQSDGSAIVCAKSTNLFVDVRKLLHYGAGCRILGDDDALWQVRKIVNDMGQLYS